MIINFKRIGMSLALLATANAALATSESQMQADAVSYFVFYMGLIVLFLAAVAYDGSKKMMWKFYRFSPEWLKRTVGVIWALIFLASSTSDSWVVMLSTAFFPHVLLVFINQRNKKLVK